VKRLLIDAIAQDPCVAYACLLEAGAALEGRTQSVTVSTHALALILDLDNMERLELDEQTLAERYEEILTTVIPPTEIVAVRTYLRTEPVPDRYGRVSPFALDLIAPLGPSDALPTSAAHPASA